MEKNLIKRFGSVIFLFNIVYKDLKFIFKIVSNVFHTTFKIVLEILRSQFVKKLFFCEIRLVQFLLGVFFFLGSGQGREKEVK